MAELGLLQAEIDQKTKELQILKSETDSLQKALETQDLDQKKKYEELSKKEKEIEEKIKSYEAREAELKKELETKQVKTLHRTFWSLHLEIFRGEFKIAREEALLTEKEFRIEDYEIRATPERPSETDWRGGEEIPEKGGRVSAGTGRVISERYRTERAY